MTFDLSQVEVGGNGSEPKPVRMWDERVGKENWNRNVSASLPGPLYEALVELSHDPRYEWGGRMQPLIRDALEYFALKFAPQGHKRTALEQLSAFRDGWVDSILGSQFLDVIGVVENSVERWRLSGEVEKVVYQFRKVVETLGKLEGEWAGFAKERLKESEQIKAAAEYAFGELPHGSEERKEMEVLYDILFG